MHLPPVVFDLCRAVDQAGGRAYVVGGCVRDHHLGRAFKDVDLEVHGLTSDQVAALLTPFGRSEQVGRSFGVFKLRVGADELDVALPRAGQSGPPQPDMGLREACRRRDLRLNAMAYDPLTGETHDPFGGLEDLRNRTLHEVDPDTFVQDPLRALRAVQLASRLQFELAEGLQALCRTQPLEREPAERLRVELEKLLLRSARPSWGLTRLEALGMGARIWPGLHLDPAVLDRAATLTLSDDGHRLAVFWGLLLLGASEPEALLDRLDVHRSHGVPVRKLALTLARELPALSDPPSDYDLRRGADQLDLFLLLGARDAWLDRQELDALLTRSAELGVAGGPLPWLLRGADLVAMGVAPGPPMGDLLRGLRESQWRGEVLGEEQARAWVRRAL